MHRHAPQPRSNIQSTRQHRVALQRALLCYRHSHYVQQSVAAARRPHGGAWVACSTAEPNVLTASPPAEAAAQQQQPEQPAVQPQQPAAPASITVKQLRLRSAAAYLPHPEKESYGGEDAHFVSNMAGGAIGVADGVGGWAESGINPADYSRMLMRVACAYIEGADVRAVASLDGWQSSPCASLNSMDAAMASLCDASSGSGSDGAGAAGSIDPAAAVAVVDPRRALDTAHKLTKLPGSATACVVQLCPEQRALIAANLGDSGFVVARQGQVVLRSSPKQHFFDCPLQFGSYPEHVDDTDTADDAELYSLPVLPGDVIVAGSDGLWDNVYPAEVLALLPRDADGVDGAADALAKLARSHAGDEEFASPYSAEAKAQGYDWPWWMKVANTRLKDGKVQLGELTGGKMDDITVLVAVVEEVEVALPLPAAPSSNGTGPAAATAAPSSNGNGNGAGAAAVPAAVPEKVSSSSGGTYSRMEPSSGVTASSSGGAAAAGSSSNGSSSMVAKAAAAAAVTATVLVAVQNG